MREVELEWYVERANWDKTQSVSTRSSRIAVRKSDPIVERRKYGRLSREACMHNSYKGQNHVQCTNAQLCLGFVKLALHTIAPNDL